VISDFVVAAKVVGKKRCAGCIRSSQAEERKYSTLRECGVVDELDGSGCSTNESEEAIKINLSDS
jgi:hypothetical protein